MLLLIYELCTMLLPMLLIWKIYIDKKDVPFWIKICLGIFGIYYAGVLHFTGAGTVFDIKLYGFDFGNDQINILPFSQQIDIIVYLLNFVLLMPCGFLLPLIAEKLESLGSIFCVSFLISMLIEISQLFNNRKTDIDDLILNIGGAVIGYVIYRLVVKAFPQISNKKKLKVFDITIYILVITLGRFFLFAEFYFARIFYM